MTSRLQSEILSEKEIKQLNIFFYYLQQAWKNSFKKYNKIPIKELFKGKSIKFFYWFVFSLKGLFNLSKNDIANSNQLKFLIELSDDYSIIYDIL